MKKPKRRMRKSLKILVLCLLVLLGFFVFYPRYQTKMKLTQLGYSPSQISILSKTKLTKTVLESNLDSPVLRKAIDHQHFYPDYFPLYKKRYGDNEITEKDILLYQRLKDKGYEEDQLENLFSNLTMYELIPLIVFDYQWDESSYIKDCEKNRSKNSETHFELSHRYRKNYKISHEIKKPEINTLVNYNHFYKEDYAPEDLVNISSQYSSQNQRLRKEAADQAVLLVQKSIEMGLNFFITDAYMDYENLDQRYQRYGDQVMKAGYSDAQSGLSFKAAVTYESAKEEALTWLKKDCVDFGFIQRYPEGKEIITGQAANSSLYRYLGVDLAKQVRLSKLSFDEYSELYLQDWVDPNLKPSESILQKAQ